jgi:hypothetical protein
VREVDERHVGWGCGRGWEGSPRGAAEDGRARSRVECVGSKKNGGGGAAAERKSGGRQLALDGDGGAVVWFAVRCSSKFWELARRSADRFVVAVTGEPTLHGGTTGVLGGMELAPRLNAGA